MRSRRRTFSTMLSLAPDQAASVLREWLDPDQPRLMAAGHVLTTGNGACLVDRWPRPQAALVVSGANYALLGDPEALDPAALRTQISGFIETTPIFARLVRQVDPRSTEWQRII